MKETAYPNHERILIVEDEPAARQRLRRVLEAEGYTVEEAGDGVEAVEILANGHADLALVDALLPRLDGFGVCRHLQTLPKNKQAPVILIAASGDQDSIDQAFEAGADDCLTKPVSWPLLRQRLRCLLHASRAEKALQEQHDLLRTLIDHLPNYIFVKDVEGRFLLSNVAHAQAVHGAVPDDLIGKTARELFPEHVAAQSHVDDVIVLETGQSLINAERVMVGPDGKARTVLTTKVPLRDAEGAVIGLVGISRDITEHKHIDAALRESNERFETLFRYSPDAMFLMDFANLMIVDCNEAACQMNGYAREELIGQSIDMLNVTPNAHEVSQQLKGRLRREGVLRLQQEHWRKDGSKITIDNSVCRVSIAGRELLVGIDRDITERQRAEDALTEERSLLRILIDNLPDNVFVKDTQSRIIIDNAPHRSLLGVAGPQDSVGKTDFDFFSSELASRYMADEQTIIQSGQAMINREEPTVDPLGNPRWLLTTKVPLRNSQGEIVGIVGINRDITERKQMEVTLKQSEARFRQLIEGSPIGIAVVRDELPVYANQALLDLFGYQTFADLANTNLLAGIAPGDRQPILAMMQANQQPLPLTMELCGQRTDGSPFPALLRIGAIPSGDGPAYIVFVTDITERKRLEEERLTAERLQVELDKEKELSDLKDRFISMVSHEYRTPLAVILSAADLLRRYEDRLPSDRKQKLLGDICIQVNYMSALLDDVLLIGRAQTGKLTFNPVRVDVESYCQRIFETVQLADQGAHRFTLIKAVEPVGSAELDERFLQQILTNLLSNAAKYSPEGTEICLELRREASHLVFRVSDQGIGIPQEDQARLFEPFHRAKNAGNTQGTGLGLAIVKRNVEALAGTIAFTSEPGAGTTFTVRLPAGAGDVNHPALSSEA